MTRATLLSGAILATLFATAACNRRPDVGPVVMSVIGSNPTLADASGAVRDEPSRILAGSLAQGLVAFDAKGQIEPGLAARWIVVDDGTTYIFRLRRAEWPDGRRVVARDVVTIVKRQIAPGSRNPLAPYLTAIRDVIEMTPDVVEIDLHRPRPDLLKLFAQPEMAILRTRPFGGSGPFRRVTGSGAAPLLVPAADPDRVADDPAAAVPEDGVRLIGERASRALIRFAAKQSDLVTGGTVADWPLTRIADLAPANMNLDPAAGLFGLVVADRNGFLGSAVNRAAIARAIDRSALTAAFADEWSPSEQILPEILDSARPPASADWVATSPEERRAAARDAVEAWRAGNREAIVRIALPEAAGGTRLWNILARDLIAVGIRPRRVGWRDPADLRLIDRVAPFDSARWYLATACDACGGEAAAAIEAARLAPTLAARADAVATADAALAADGGYIPIARPFRWSLVALRLRAWQPNGRAWHPLNHLRGDPK